MTDEPGPNMEGVSIKGFIMAKKTMSDFSFTPRNQVGQDEVRDGAISLFKVREDIHVGTN